MRFRGLLPSIAIIVMALGAPAAYAQRAGFVTAGIPFIQSPVQPFVSSPVGPFGVMPAITPPIISTFVSPTHFVGGFSRTQPGFIVGPPFVTPNNGVTIFIQQGAVVVPGSTTVFGPGSFFGPAIAVAPPVGPAFAPVGAFVMPAPTVVPVPATARIPAGTPRAQVIQQLGVPLVTIVTRDGEALGFAGGVTIFIQNGIVVIR